MFKDTIKKYYIHMIIILLLLVIIEGIVIFQNNKSEEKYEVFIKSKIVLSANETMENTSRIQNYLEKAKESSEISNRTLEQIAKWYDEMFNYAHDIKDIYFIYQKSNSMNYTTIDINYFSRRVNEIEDILEAEYKNGQTINDNTDINKYKEKFDKIFEFNSLFIETMVQKDAIAYEDGRYWVSKKFNNNELFVEDFFYWNIYNDFFKLLNSKEFM
jgi:hypothetical protein